MAQHELGRVGVDRERSRACRSKRGPAPSLSAARPASSAAPAMPSAPPMMPTEPAMPLWKFFGRGLRTLENSARFGDPAVRDLGGKIPHGKVGNRDLPAMVRPVQREQAGLQADEGDGVRRAHRAAEDLPGIGMQAARDVEREHRAGLRVGVVDQLRVLAVDRSGQADAEQAVDHEVPAGLLSEFPPACLRGKPGRTSPAESAQQFSRRRRCCRGRRGSGRPCPCRRAASPPVPPPRRPRAP